MHIISGEAWVGREGGKTGGIAQHCDTFKADSRDPPRLVLFLHHLTPPQP